MIREILELVLITFLPIFELRGSIPYGVLKLNMNWIDVFIICVLANIAVGMLVYFLLDKFVHLITRFKAVGRVYARLIVKPRKNIKYYVEKYGELGVAIFIGVPLPGSGVYSAALGSYLLGMNYKDFLIACIAGVLIAGTAVMLITLFGSGAWSFFIKRI
jgi:uncharacterized membrane protein